MISVAASATQPASAGQATRKTTMLASAAAMYGASDAFARAPRTRGYAAKSRYGTAAIHSSGVAGVYAVMIMATKNGMARTASTWRSEIQATTSISAKRMACSAISVGSGGCSVISAIDETAMASAAT